MIYFLNSVSNLLFSGIHTKCFHILNSCNQCCLSSLKINPVLTPISIFTKAHTSTASLSAEKNIIKKSFVRNRNSNSNNKYPQDATVRQPVDNVPSFAKMLRNSALVQMGDPEGAVLNGKIIEIMDDNLFIDFGAKLHCVCRKPRYKSDRYRRGTSVVIKLNDLELASVFMGSDKGITLLEADAILLGLAESGEKDQQYEQVNRKKVSEQLSSQEVFFGETVTEDDELTQRGTVEIVKKSDKKSSDQVKKFSSGKSKRIDKEEDDTT